MGLLYGVFGWVFRSLEVYVLSEGEESHSKGMSVTAEEVMITRFTEGVAEAAARMEVVSCRAGETMSFS